MDKEGGIERGRRKKRRKMKGRRQIDGRKKGDVSTRVHCVQSVLTK
jgi:hypothetical protein